MKRKKRIVDYAKYITLSDRGEKVDRKTQEQGEQFMALNETLKDELPKLFNLSSKLIEVCLVNFVDLQLQWHSIWQRKVKTLLGEQEVPEDVASIVTAFHDEFSYVEASVLSLGICNGSLLADISNFLSSSSASFATDDTLMSNSNQRRHLHKASAASSTGGDSPRNREFDRYSGGSLNMATARSSTESQRRNYHQQQPAHSYQQGHRSPSAVSGRSSRKASRSFTSGSAPYHPHQDFRHTRSSADTHSHQTPPLPHMSVSSRQSHPGIQARSLSTSTSHSTTIGPFSSSPMIGTAMSDHTRDTSGVFSSAMPMSDSLPNTRPVTPHATSGQHEYETLFLAASLYDFNIKQERSEAGYPYLFYAPGEVFDVIGQKGELWLAKNQDDASQRIGWIWEKHFAKLMSED